MKSKPNFWKRQIACLAMYSRLLVRCRQHYGNSIQRHRNCIKKSLDRQLLSSLLYTQVWEQILLKLVSRSCFRQYRARQRNYSMKLARKYRH
ncbi:hypothetical protein FGO68_gene7153 [Halteria grandinella]|uniref:Uncharacterized protein n=1 Tax=Halteria grandinella TaxID=5974 RepID=A0A8J8T3U4_HALGN|nr:hypothetical protein FGO68_gene7153 [Halteria grandinella]